MQKRDRSPSMLEHANAQLGRQALTWIPSQPPAGAVLAASGGVAVGDGGQAVLHPLLGQDLPPLKLASLHTPIQQCRTIHF